MTIVAQDTAGRLKCPDSLALKALELLQKRREKVQTFKEDSQSREGRNLWLVLSGKIFFVRFLSLRARRTFPKIVSCFRLIHDDVVVLLQEYPKLYTTHFLHTT